MIFNGLKYFWKDNKGLAAVEVSLVLPVLLTILLGMVDLGHGMMVKKKAIGAAQMVGDLLTRTATVTQGDINDAILAGSLAIAPYPSSNYGIDIASMQFVGDQATPEVLWRETYNTSPNDSVEEYVDGLGVKGDGVMVVTVNYDFEPYFTGFIMDRFTFSEVSFTRGRRAAVVRKE